MFYNKFLRLSRRKLSFFIIPWIIISLIFIIYQILIFMQLSSTDNHIQKRHYLIRGIHDEEEKFYKLETGSMFTCIKSQEKISLQKINDDYCDCLDGSDEPGTSACGNSMFYCATVSTNFPEQRHVHSSKVNDGICDCCDGSDEWKNSKLLHNNITRDMQTKLNRYQVPCPYVC